MRLLNLVPWSPVAGVLLVGVLLMPGAPAARAYQFDAPGGTPTRWRAPASPATIWTDATQTLTWHFNPLNFPQATWPAVAQAGAAFENGYKTIQDVPGTSLKIVRGPDAASAPMNNGDRLDMCFALNGLDPFTGANISAYFAVTYIRTNGSGTLTDADIVMNGNAAAFTWRTSNTPPAGTNDVEVTACHEQIHSIGGGHPVYFYSMVWPTGRVPELTLVDRCISPDDRNLIRTLYPGTPALRTITGTVTGGDRAIVVATDGNGIPQAACVADGGGGYSINVPAGTGYMVTAHHHSYTEYDPSDINFDPPPATATAFISATTVGPLDLSGGNAAAPAIALTLAPPTMKITGVRPNGGAMGTQVAFLPKGSSGTLQLEITTGQPFTSVTGNTASLGLASDITVGAVTAVAGGVPGTTIVSIPYTVSAAAVAGCKNLSFSVASGERLFVPAYVEVVDTTSSLTVAASAGNPPAQAVALGGVDVPLLGFTLTANAVEDIRIRSLRFNLSGSGSQMPDVRLWLDNGTLGLRDGPDVRVFSGNAYATPGTIAETIPAGPTGTVTFDNLALTIPVGQSVNFLFTGNTPAAGNSTYTVDLVGSGANINATGMYYGNNIAATGTAAGNQQDAGSLALAGLDQTRTTGGTQIPVGGSTTENQVTLRGVVTTSSGGTVGLEVEVKPIGQAFTNVATASVTGQTSGSTVSVVVNPPLLDNTLYHWQARPTCSNLPAGNWVSFGNNPENQFDFGVDKTTVVAPTALGQFEADGVTPVPPNPPAAVNGPIILRGTCDNTPSRPVRLEIEVQPNGTPFGGTPNLFSTFSAAPATLSIGFNAASGQFNWQARTTNDLGSSSGWVAFSATTPNFDLVATGGGGGGGGCSATIPGGGAGFWWGLLALGLLLVGARGRTV